MGKELTNIYKQWYYYQRKELILMIIGHRIKLKPEFLEKCKFQDLILPNTINHEFVEFVNEQFHNIGR